MLILPQEVEIRWHHTNRNWYENKGYKFTGFKKPLLVNVIDLIKTSKAKIEVICDYCNVKLIKEYESYRSGRKIVEKDCCSNESCKQKKKEEISLIKYNVKFPSQLESVKNKIKQTNLEKYGATTYTQTDEYKEKVKTTLLEKYGVENPMMIDGVKEKLKQTMIERYGFEFATQSEEVKQKTKETNLNKYGVEFYVHTSDYKEKTKKTLIKKYGVDSVFKNKEIRKKALNTINKKYGVEVTNVSQISEIRAKAVKSMYKNGTAPCSKQQEYIHKLLGGELNYPHFTSSLDIAFPDDKIYIEYDGGGHELSVKFGDETKDDFDKRNRDRWYALYRKGWKQIRIISKDDKLPSDEIIQNIYDYSKNYLLSGHSWIEIDIDNKILLSSVFKKEYDFGELRLIKS